ncbi:hypothetical protein [Endozoicomonas sp. 8E]|uniref:hypothetical protein n=1 Tax=Endozoicomonas sp. 8E TaxID=3035692 RepID=UPI0029394133|nr:hypothetical protein [Endozoicomonas sp. 8E]WOG27078.1 hypothetical protein P6910_21385 [Endozoicomonas sp. 8E]
MLLSLSVACQCEALTGRFIIELKQDAGFTNKGFSIKRDLHKLPGNPSDIADTKGYAGSELAPDDKRHRSGSYGLKTANIELISWHWLYATNLLIAFELILSSRGTPLSYVPCSRLPVEAFVAVVWLFKNYWSHDSPLSNTTEQQETSQDHPFVISTMMPGSRHDQQQGQLSESPGQQAPQVTSQSGSSATSHLDSGSGQGNGDPQQHSHTLDLNCFIHPCNGVCKFRPTSGQSSHPFLVNRYSYGCISHFDSVYTKHSRQHPPFLISINPPAAQVQFVSGRPYQPQAHQPQPLGTDSNLTNSCNSGDGVVMNSMSAATPCTGYNGLLNDDLPMPGHCPATDDDLIIINGLLNLSSQIQASDRSQQSMRDATLAGENVHHRTWGKLCKNAETLSDRKRRDNTRQQACQVSVVDGDHQPRPCGKVCNNAKALSDHKRREHGSQKTCVVTVVGEDGQKRPCGKICKSAGTLSDHKKRDHTGQQTCSLTVVEKDGQLRPCGTLCKNAPSLVTHKSKCHTGQQTCKVTSVEEDGRLRSCGKPFNNSYALTLHKRREHSKQKTCEVAVVGEDSQPRPCGKVCKNNKALWDHKRVHRKRKPVDVDGGDD